MTDEKHKLTRRIIEQINRTPITLKIHIYWKHYLIIAKK